MSGTVVIGAGQAAASLCEALRGAGYGAPITVVGDEPHPPYQRPPLSKAYLLGDMARDRLFLRPESYYADKNIRLITGVRADSIDCAARAVVLSTGETLTYDSLVLATGTTPRLLDCPGAGHTGVFYVRSIADIDALEAALPDARRAVVVGGGYIGLEAAAVLRKKDLEVSILHRSGRLLSRVASGETAEYFRELHTQNGAHVRLNQTVSAIEGAGRVEQVSIERTAVDHVARDHAATLEADMVVVGIGVRPNQRLAADAGLACDNGICVDSEGRTSDPHVYAVGDVASFPTERYGRLRLESVQNAIDQPQVIARNIMGGSAAYEPKPWFWSDQYDVKFQSAGLPYGYDAVTARIGANGAASYWLTRGAELICVEAMNDPRGYMVGKRLIEARKTPDMAVVADPAADLKALLR